MDDTKDIVDSLDETMTMAENLPEAPQSNSIVGYFKGFSATFTIRRANNKSIPVDKIENLINTLIERGWKPSWNTSTNEASEPQTKACSLHHEPMKKAKSGKWYHLNDDETQMCQGTGWFTLKK